MPKPSNDRSIAGRLARAPETTETIKKRNRLIGWREWLALPELGIDRIRAKVDTGARTSALHAVNISPFERDGKSWVSFVATPRSGGVQDRTQVQCEARAIGIRRVKNSSGSSEQRVVISTPIEIGGRRLNIEITLTNRSEMGHEMLLGRSGLRQGGFIVHPSKSDLQQWTAPADVRREK